MLAGEKWEQNSMNYNSMSTCMNMTEIEKDCSKQLKYLLKITELEHKRAFCVIPSPCDDSEQQPETLQQSATTTDVTHQYVGMGNLYHASVT